MHASRKETAGQKTPRVQTPNGQLAGLAATETTGDALALTLEIIRGLGACPERVKLVRDGREEVANSKARRMEPKSVEIENRIPGGAQVVVTCAGAVGAKLRKEIEAVLRVAALSAELCARKLWRPEQPEAESGGAAGIVGASAASLGHVKEIEIIARSSHPVMITGERGTGKTTTARAIHERSARRDKPFLDLDCTSLTESLLEAELFGHEKGSFTGATERKRGLFEMADGGTLFLDEVAELPPWLQVKLLKAVEQMKFRRVGGTQDVKVNVRITAATSQDLKAMTADGRFRAELFDRLSVLDFRTTPLREKREDVPALVSHRLAAEQRRNGRKSPYRIEEEAVRLLVTHDWPGNVRELQNVIARLTARVSEDEAITVEDVRRVLPAARKQTLHLVRPQGSEGRQVLPESLMYREEGETIREYLSRAFVAVAEITLEEHGGCLTHAGAELGVNRSNLRTRLREARLIVRERELRISRDVADAA